MLCYPGIFLLFGIKLSEKKGLLCTFQALLCMNYETNYQGNKRKKKGTDHKSVTADQENKFYFTRRELRKGNE